VNSVLSSYLYENGITKIKIYAGDKEYNRIPIYIYLDKNTLSKKQLLNYLNAYINSLKDQNAKKYSINIKQSSSYFKDEDTLINLEEEINNYSNCKLSQEIQSNYKDLEKLNMDLVIKKLGKPNYKYHRFPDRYNVNSSKDVFMELIWCYILDRNTAKELVLIFDYTLDYFAYEQPMLYVKHASIDINSHLLIPTKCPAAYYPAFPSCP